MNETDKLPANNDKERQKIQIIYIQNETEYHHIP